MSVAEQIEELRLELRRRSFIGGRVFFAHNQSALDCTIRDISSSGARIEFTHPFVGPSELILQIGTGDNVRDRVPCTVQWTKGKQVGHECMKNAAAEA